MCDTLYMMTYTKEQLEAYIKQVEQRMKESSSPWMKAECRKALELAKAELAKLIVEQERV